MSKDVLILGLIIFFCLAITCLILCPASANSNLTVGWTNGTSMPRSIFEISATVMNGKIYVAGGQDEKGDLLNTLFVYDRSSEKWHIAASLPVALDHSSLASCENKLYLVGGFLEHRVPTDQFFIYDSQTNTWKEGKPTPTTRAGLGSQFIDGILYAVGGSSGDNEGALSTNEAYVPQTNSWTKKAPMPTAR